MIRILLVLLATALPMAASEPFKQTLAKVAQEREPAAMMDIYGEYPVSGTTFWVAVFEYLGPYAKNFPPYRGSQLGAEWHAVYPHVAVYLQGVPSSFTHNPDPLQRLNIAEFLDTHYGAGVAELSAEELAGLVPEPEGLP